MNRKNNRTGLTLIIEGYDFVSGKITQIAGGICLIDGENIVAKWPFTGIIDHWKRKHSQAVYVPSKCEIKDKKRSYWYGPVVRMGEGTDVFLLLRAMHEGYVYYDPGIKLENIHTKPISKRRSQFRIRSKDIKGLYKVMKQEEVII